MISPLWGFLRKNVNPSIIRRSPGDSAGDIDLLFTDNGIIRPRARRPTSAMIKTVAQTANPTRTLLRPSVEALFVFGSRGGLDVFTRGGTPRDQGVAGVVSNELSHADRDEC